MSDPDRVGGAYLCFLSITATRPPRGGDRQVNSFPVVFRVKHYNEKRFD